VKAIRKDLDQLNGAQVERIGSLLRRAAGNAGGRSLPIKGGRLMPDPSNLRFKSVEPFLDWHERQPRRYELEGGRPMMQAGANRGHERIAKNVFRELDAQVDHTRFDVNKSDFGLQVGIDDDGRPIVRYPDVVVDEQTGNDDDRIATNPVLAVEVLSRSTEKPDVGIKPEEYGSIPSLNAYLAFDRDKAVVQVWQRDEKGRWPSQPRQVKGDEDIDIPALNVRIRLSAVYVVRTTHHRDRQV
jgi:Uma2 family endonuclease